MRIPKDWNFFQKNVHSKIEMLCQTKLWSKDIADVHAWLSNFKKDEHQYLALHLLDSVIFRTKDMVRSAYNRFLYCEFRKIVRKEIDSSPPHLSDWIEKFRNGWEPWTNNIKITSACDPDSLGESGHIILRAISKDNIREKMTCTLSSGKWSAFRNKIILIVDDFLGSGDQIDTYARNVDLETGIKNNNIIIYAPLVAMPSGVATAQANHPNIKIMPVELLDNNEGVFRGNPTDYFRYDKQNKIEDALNCYQDIKRVYGIKHRFWMGRNDAGLSIGFDWGCPNQTLGIFYANSNGFRPLFSRRE